MRADEQELRQRARVEREGDLVGDGLGARVRTVAAAGGRDERRRVAGCGVTTRSARASQAAASAAQARRRAARRVRASAGVAGLELGGGQDVGERVEVVADADAALGGRLERAPCRGRRTGRGRRRRAAVARDEGVGERRREAREVRAHRVEAVAPEAGLVLPLGLDGEGGSALGSSRASWPASGRFVVSGIPGLRLDARIGLPARRAGSIARRIRGPAVGRTPHPTGWTRRARRRWARGGWSARRNVDNGGVDHGLQEDVARPGTSVGVDELEELRAGSSRRHSSDPWRARHPDPSPRSCRGCRARSTRRHPSRAEDRHVGPAVLDPERGTKTRILSSFATSHS